MKALILTLLTLLFSKGCNTEQQTDLKDTLIQYTTNTRGYYKNVVIKDQTISIGADRQNKNNVTTLKIDAANWKKLVTEFQKIDLEKLSSYKDPTQARFYDGAYIADLQIIFKQKEYRTKKFDHGTPPVEIEELVNLIVEVSNL